VYDPAFSLGDAFLDEDAVMNFNVNGATQVQLGVNYFEGVDAIPHYSYGL
jgi:hypothetical protein